VSAVLFAIKAKQKNNLAYLAQGASRIYMMIIFIMEAHFEKFGLDMGDVAVAVMAVFAADIISLFISVMGRKYVKDIEYLKTVSNLKDLSSKFGVIVESAVTGFFTVDRTGKIEFVNQAILNLLEYSREELVGKNLLDFVDPQYRDNILLSTKFSYRGVKVTTKSGKVIQTYFTGGYTRNGHDTITGSIIEIS
jgi:PAS domain S-box-containing protein